MRFAQATKGKIANGDLMLAGCAATLAGLAAVRLAALATLHILVLVHVLLVTVRAVTVVHLYLFNIFLSGAKPEINCCHILNSRCQCAF
jgi:hypothetical protein